MDQHFARGQPTTGVNNQPPQLPVSLIKKTVMDTADAAIVRLESGQSNSHLLQMAARFQASVIGITACMPVQLSSGDGYIDGEVFKQDRKEIDKAIVAARTAFRDAMGTRTRDLDWRWMVIFGPLADYLAAEARRADLISDRRPSKDLPNRARQINLGDFIIQAGRPVLIAATEALSLKLNRAMVAWKDTREARRAAADVLALGGVTRSLLGTSLRSVSSRTDRDIWSLRCMQWF
jgi:hypothetical protein